MNEPTSDIITTPEEPQPKDKRLSFEELTLWQVFWLFLYHPMPTLQRFFDAIALPPEEKPRREPRLPAYEHLPPSEAALTAPIAPAQEMFELPQVDFGKLINIFPSVVLGGLLVSSFFAIIGASRLWKAANDQLAHAQGDLKGAPFWFFLAALSYLIISIVASYPYWMRFIKRMGGGNAPPEDYEPPVEPESEIQSTETAAEVETHLEPTRVPSLIDSFFGFIERHSLRLALIPPAFFMSYLSFNENVVVDDVTGKISEIAFTTFGFVTWVLAILFWFCILAVDLNGIVARVYYAIIGRAPFFQRPRFRFRVRWQHFALVFILVLAAYFRLHNLEGVPPDMTSDHIEKLKDAVRVDEGYYAIFFENNGGREAFQMYFIALLEKLPGIEFNFNALKLASIIEGMLTVFAGYWLGQVMMGKNTPEDREMGIWLGLSFAALLAISSWHTMISRLGLRIALTPLTTVLLLIFLTRAMRHNRRLDFVMVGVILGAGTYFYQANRMLPIVVVIGTMLAVAFYARKWSQLVFYGVNLACTIIMAVVIFLPMYRYEREYPEYFWSRTRGRMFGDNAFERVVNETGLTERYEPTIREQIDRFLDNSENFEENYVNALEMWSWQGDALWINNPYGRPALDPYTDAFFILGVLAWAMLMLKKGDAAHILVPIGILVMLLPSALAIHDSIQNENPSFTRASGTIPFVFLMAAYPLAQLGFYARRVTRYNIANLGLAAFLILPIVGLAIPINYDTYFEKYPELYTNSWKPYTYFTAPMKEYLAGGGSYGNAFLVAWPHWLDHRIVGATAGDLKWPNGLVEKEQVFSQISSNENTPYQFDPTKPMFFMYHLEDTETKEWLSANFPGGEHFIKEHPEREALDFGYYIVPAGVQAVGR